MKLTLRHLLDCAQVVALAGVFVVVFVVVFALVCSSLFLVLGAFP